MMLCAEQSERREDSMLGTAPPQARILLVHQPGPWGPRGLIESRCDPHVARRIDAAAAAMGMRLQTIRRPGKHEVGMPAGGHHVGIATTSPSESSIAWWRVDDLSKMADELEHGMPRLPPAEVDTAPLYLVCAHGRHDPCCALRGRPVAAALERARPGRVWETTHLGGDRFAANLLVLPTGQLYGRVPPQIASELADRTDEGNVLPALMRGRIGLSPIEQAALVYAHERLGVFGRNALKIVSVERLDAERSRVYVSAPHGTVAVTVGVKTGETAQMTCRGPSNARAREYRGLDLREAATT